MASKEVSLPPGAFTIDVEEWFHAETIHAALGPEQRKGYPSRVGPCIERILGHLAARGIHATFFVLNQVAEQHPGLIRTIAEAGHEIASHGCDHHMLTRMSPDEFRIDAERSKKSLEDITGFSVQGYRAPTFSITSWAIPILQELGYTYDSSLFPIAYHDRYGSIDAPGNGNRIFEVIPGFREIPLSTIRAAGRQLPWSGGGYFRLMPYFVFRKGMRLAIRQNGYFIFYFHPWEIDADQPRVESLTWFSRFRQYNHLSDMEGKVVHLLDACEWTTISNLLALGQDGYGLQSA